MDKIMEMLPFLIPVLIIELAMMAAALVHILRHPRYRFGNKALWISVVVIFQIIGPIAYFIFGRSDE